MSQLEAELEEGPISAELYEDDSEEEISLEPPPQDLHLKKAEWNQYERGVEMPTSFGLPVGLFSCTGALIAGSLAPSAAILSVNLPFLYGWKQMHDANKRKSELDGELENWRVFGNDYDLSDLLEGSMPLEDRGSDEMLESYETILQDFRDVDEEIEELTETNIANEDFYDDCLYAIQAVRIEEDDDFGGYYFQANIYLDGKELETYSGATTDDEVVEKLNKDGIEGTEARSRLTKHFDVGKPLGITIRKPDPL